MHEKLSKGLKLGFIGNILFLAFGFICYIYYKTYSIESGFSKFMEFLAYTVEFLGFISLVFSDIYITSAVRMRNLLKIFYPAYIALEAVMMVLEINSWKLSFYNPHSLGLAIIHSVASAAVCFTFLQFDPDKNKFEVLIIICIGIILGGMMGNIIGIRVYFSIITNALSFTIMFRGIIRLLRNEDIEIDCHGDKARVTEFKSSLFD